MKVIFIKDLKKQGKKNEIKEVSDGYATNYLIKNGYAVKYTKSSSERLDMEMENHRLREEEDTIISLQDQVYDELAVRYGLDLDMYNLGLSVGGRYINDYENKDGDWITSHKIERDYLVSFKLENEFIFDEFTVGLDLFYNINGDIKEKTNGITTAKFGSYNEYGFNVDANYALTEDNNYVGLYFTMAQSDIKGPKDSAQQYKEPTEYKFGLKFVSEF